MNDILILVVLVAVIGGVLYWKKLEKKKDTVVPKPTNVSPEPTIVPAPIVLRPPLTEPLPQAPVFRDPVPGPNKPAPTPENPEPAPWGYNGHPVSDMNITPEKSNQHQPVWLHDGQAVTFTVNVPTPRGLEVWVSNTPLLGNPDPSLSRHEIECLLTKDGNTVGKIEPTFIASARLTASLSPGVYLFTAKPLGYTGGASFQFLYH